MKRPSRYAALALAGVLLAGCAPAGGSASSPSAPAGPKVQADWSVLEEKEPLPAVGGRLYQQYTPELIPQGSYGPLLPFAGSLGLTLAWWEEEPDYTSPAWFYGLMTQDGTLVMDAVCSSITRCSYSQTDAHTGKRLEQLLPVYALTRGDQARGRPGTGELVALAALDGSWRTDDQYWGAVAYPGGVAAGNGQGLTLLDARTGAEIRRFTWPQLGLPQDTDLPWFTGDASGSPQWTGETIFLGVLGPDWDTAYFLDPDTGAVTTCSASDWYGQWDAWYNSPAYESSIWVSKSNGDGTITLTRGEEQHTFPSPLPQDEYPSVLDNDLVYFCFWDQKGCSFAVTDLEGNVLIPAQEGELTVLNGTGEGGPLLFAIPREGQWYLYDRDGKELFALPGGTGSYCYLNEELIEILQPNCASYYRIDTGECIRRTYAGLPG